LAKKLKPLGIPILYYISPQVWAWGKGRLKQIHDYVDRMLVILPFEEDFYRQHEVPCQFVGHYLLEDIPEKCIGSSPSGNRQIALLPGSRSQEIERMLPSMLKAAAIVNGRHGTRAVVAAIEGAYDYESACDRYEDRGVTISYQSSRQVVYESDLVLTASGTATLETGVIGRPMVIVYKTGWLTYQIARRLVRLESIGLVNLVLGQRAVPELIQSQATPNAMATALERYLVNDTYRTSVQAALRTVPSILGGRGASHAAAAEIGAYL
jgi:lipid-A-disaccharide synthase